MKKMLSFAFCVLFLCSISLPADASVYNLQATYADLIEESVSVSVNSDGSYTYSISAEQLAAIQSTASRICANRSVDDNSLNDQILAALGYTELEIAALRADAIDDDLLSAGWIVKNTTYYKYDSLTGKSEIISETEYKQLLNSNSSIATASINSGGESDIETADGLYSISTMAEYLPNYIRDEWEDVQEDGWFRFTGMVTHEIPTFVEYTDAISLYADPANISWGDTSTDFSSFLIEKDGDGNETTSHKSSTDRHIGIGGAYYTWEFPLWRSVTVGIKGYGRVSNYNNACVFDVYTGYVDYDEEPDTDFSFSFGTGGVGVSVAFGNEEFANEYYGRCQVTYDP